MNLLVKYSAEKDASTYVNFIYKFSSYAHGYEDIQGILLSKLEPVLQEIIKTAASEESAFKDILKYLEEKYKTVPTPIDESIKKLNNSWDKIGNNIIYSLEFLYGKPFPFETITAYLTTSNIYPYSYEQHYFYTSIKYVPSQLATAKHELNHFMFYYYYPHLKDKLSDEKYELLKESLTFFSNSDHEGKPNEKPLRELYLSKIWKSFDEAVNAGCEFLNK